MGTLDNVSIIGTAIEPHKVYHGKSMKVGGSIWEVATLKVTFSDAKKIELKKQSGVGEL